MPIWNPNAIDYSKGVDICDCITEKVYTEQEAENLPDHIKRRLVIRGRKIGCMVMTIEEVKKCQNSK